MELWARIAGMKRRLGGRGRGKRERDPTTPFSELLKPRGVFGRRGVKTGKGQAGRLLAPALPAPENLGGLLSLAEAGEQDLGRGRSLPPPPIPP